MNIDQISYSLAFLAGIASFLSPCVLALVPAYIGFLGSQSAMHQREGFNKHERLDTIVSGVFFVLGFSFIFILLGAATSVLGSILYNVKDWLTKIGGIVVILLGLHTTGIIQIPFLMVDTRYQKPIPKEMGYLSAFLMGIIFSAGWSPCVGPVLGAILTLSLQGKSILFGASLLTAYSLGLAVPFLLAAIGLNWVMVLLQKYGALLHVIQIIMGVILIIVGVLLFFNIYAYLANFGNLFNISL